MPQEGKLKQTLSLAECVFFGVGSVLGAGIYAIIGKVAGFGGNMVWLSFAIASLTALMTAFSYAELSSMFPGAGGEYLFAKHAYTKKIAILLGFLIAGSGVVSGATVSLGFAGYLSQFLELKQWIAAIGIIVLMLVVNISGIRQSSTVNIIFTCIEIAGLAFVVVAAWNSLGSVSYFELPPDGLNGLLLAASLSYFAFLGFEEIIKLGKETKKPERTIPKALFISWCIVIVVYLLVAISAVSVVSWQELKGSSSPLADIVESKYGRIGMLIISAIALFSTTNTILSNLLGASRVMYEMGEETKGLSLFSHVPKLTKTPVYSLIAIAAVMIIFALIGRIEVVALIANFFLFATFILVNIAVIVLRKNAPEAERPYKIPFVIGNVPIPSVIGILLTLVLIGYGIYGLTERVY